MQTFTLYPSDFGFLYQECKTCFYHKYKNNLWRPKFNLPSIFTKIDTHMTSFYDNKSSKIINTDLQEGIVALGGTYVQSKPIKINEFQIELIIKGKIDSLILFEDGTIGVIDFKTTQISEDKTNLYFNQLSAYATCLEHNDDSVNKHYKVSELGLVVFEPNSFDQEFSSAKISGDLQWIKINQDRQKFKSFLKEVAELLSRDSMELNPKCSFCKYRKS